MVLRQRRRDAGLDGVPAGGDALCLRVVIDGKRQDSAGAKLHGDELHDGMQRAGGELPNCLSPSFGSDLAASEWCCNVKHLHPADERDVEYDLFVGLHHEPAHVSNNLRPFISIPVID
jgi:hypothetical protein